MNIQVDNNVFENNWQAQQSGAVFLLTPRTGDGSYKDVFVRNVVFTNNIIRHAPEGVSLLDYDNGAAINSNVPIDKLWLSGNYTFRNNFLDDISACLYASCTDGIGYGMAFSGLPDRLTIDSTTIRFASDPSQTYQSNQGLLWNSQYQYAGQGVTYPGALDFSVTNTMLGYELWCDGNSGPVCVPHSQDGVYGIFSGNVILEAPVANRAAQWALQFPEVTLGPDTGAVGADIVGLTGGECAIKLGNRTTGATCISPGYPSNVTP